MGLKLNIKEFMARITIEDCLINEENRFSLVRLAAKRAKQIYLGAKAVTDSKGNRPVVAALREIAAGKVRFPRERADESIDSDESLIN